MCCGFIFDEISCLAKLSFPTMLFNTMEVLLQVSDMMVLGSVGKEALAVGALGNAFYNMVWFFNEGVLTAQDNLSSQEFGLRNTDGIRRWMYVSMLVLLPLCALGSVLMLFSPLIVEDAFRLHGEMITKVSLYVILLIPALWFQAAFRIAQKFLLAQHVLRPSLWVMTVGLGINILCNYIFVVVLDGSATGCALSTSVTRGLMVLLLGGYMRYSQEGAASFAQCAAGLTKFIHMHFKELRTLRDQIYRGESGRIFTERGNSDSEGVELAAGGGTRDGEADDGNGEDTDLLLSAGTPMRDHGDSSSFPSLTKTKKDVLLFLSLGVPGGLVLVVELWTFDIATVLVSQIGNVSVASQSILLMYTSVSFVIIPLSLSIAASVRVSQLLASKNSRAAKVTALLSVYLAIVLCGSSAYLFYSLRDVLGYLFTSDPSIVHRCSQLAGVFSLLQFTHGVQGAAQGVMRGMNRQRELFGFTFFSYWLLGLPLGVYLTFFTRPRFGLFGLWCGFSTGLAVLSLVLVASVLLTDWEREVWRTELNIEWHSRGSSTRAEQERGRASLLAQAAAVPGGRALGGFALLDGRTEEQELDELERIEVSLATSPIEVGGALGGDEDDQL